MFRHGDVVLYWGDDYIDRWVGIVTDVHEDGSPIVKWQNAVSKSWRPPRVIQISDHLVNIGRMPDEVYWDV